jgi:hypothetical protein
MAGAVKKAHHFVPRFYLAGFAGPAGPARLWQYDKVRGEVTESSPRRAGRRRHYHSIPKKDGTVDVSVENALAVAENQSAPLLRRLIGGEALDNRERSVLSYFIALMLVRVPAFRDGVAKFKAAIVKDMTRLMARRGAFDSIPVPKEAQESIGKAREALRQGEFDVEVHPHGSLDALLAAEKIAGLLHRMTWVLLGSHGRIRYVTSDNPVTYVDPAVHPRSPRPVGLMNRTIEVTFPLSSSMALMAGWPGGGGIHRRRATENTVRQINRRTAAGASRFVYAAEKSDQLMNLVMKFKDSGVRWEVS